MTDFSALPQWRCHKVVRAAKIASTQEMDDRWYVELVDIPGLEGILSVAPTVFARGVPEQGDYLVVYDDSYISWSPAKAFEDGYSPLANGMAP